MSLGDYSGIAYMTNSGLFLYSAKIAYSYSSAKEGAKKEVKTGLEKELE